MVTTELLKNRDAVVNVEEKGEKRLIHVECGGDSSPVSDTWETSYPIELIEHVLRVKGPASLCDEIRRDEDPLYVQHRLNWDILGFVDGGAFSGKRVLDFGSGSGASSMVLARLLPADAKIVGVELVPEFADLARSRARYYGVDDRVTYLLSPGGDALPDDIGMFDFIVLSAVFEHLLPDERVALLPLLWSHLKPGGVLFLDQTPYRWFPVEMHTTGLPFINYFPRKMALAYAQHFSSRVQRDESWPTLLRRGIRGGTESEALKIVNEGERGDQPAALFSRDRRSHWPVVSNVQWVAETAYKKDDDVVFQNH